MKQQEKKTYQDVINETVEYYSKDPKGRRSISENGKSCLYNGPNGEQCALARCAEPIDKKYESVAAFELLDQKGMEILKPEYRHLDNIDFWDEIQFLHDGSSYWTNSGLSAKGKEQVNRLLRSYCQ